MFLWRRGIDSPLALGAVVALVLNDHVLKRVCPSALTGKLSDLAGLFLFPVLVGALAGRRARPVAALAAVVGGAAFAASKLSPLVAAWVSAHVMSTTCDPTDLIALPMLALGVRHVAPMVGAPALRLRERIAALVAALASVATSAQPHAQVPQAPVLAVAAPHRCARLEVAGLEPKPSNEVVVHARLVNDDPAALRCDVTLVAALEGAPSDRVRVETRGRSSVVPVDPGRAVDVTITLSVPYPVSCAAPLHGTVEAFEQPDGYGPQDRPAASGVVNGCVTAVATP